MNWHSCCYSKTCCCFAWQSRH